MARLRVVAQHSIVSGMRMNGDRTTGRQRESCVASAVTQIFHFGRGLGHIPCRTPTITIEAWVTSWSLKPLGVFRFAGPSAAAKRSAFASFSVIAFRDQDKKDPDNSEALQSEDNFERQDIPVHCGALSGLCSKNGVGLMQFPHPDRLISFTVENEQRRPPMVAPIGSHDLEAFFGAVRLVKRAFPSPVPIVKIPQCVRSFI